MDESYVSESLIGREAPDFHAQAMINGEIVDNVSLDFFRGKQVLLCFYPLDFTFVCPTELHAFQRSLSLFRERDTEVVACSIDSVFCHLAWFRTPRNKGGIQGVEFPIISDIHRTIAGDYRVLSKESGVAFRGLFLIDQHRVIRYVQVNDLPIGRSTGETLRIIDALAHYRERGEVCPANWEVGEKSMIPTEEGLERYFGT